MKGGIHAWQDHDPAGARLGCHHGRWRDVVMVERRSTVAGTR
jgi:hypothetical protein